MKKGWKVYWIICGIVFCIGAMLCMTGGILGAKASDVGEILGDGIYFNSSGLHVGKWHMGSRGEETEEAGSRTAYKGITELDVDTAGVRLELLVSDDNDVYVETEGISPKLNYRCAQSGSSLEIRTETSLSVLNQIDNDPVIRVYLPLGTLEEIELDTGAGEIYAKRLEAESISVDIGAGEANLEEFTAEELELECGAGEITGSGTVLRSAEIECGIGEVDLTLNGKEEYYQLSVDCGIGEVTIGGHTFSGIAAGREDAAQDTDRRISVECGIGEVNISFTE